MSGTKNPRKRKSISPRLRFEILKRDGFRCRYCGSTPLDSLLRVDHVIPVAKGGTGDPANLIAACVDCNGGKSDVGLEESRIAAAADPDALRQQAAQIAEYLEACRELERAREEFRTFVAEKWMTVMGLDRMPEAFVTSLVRVAKQHGMEMVDEAMRITQAKGVRGKAAERYFHGVVNRKAANG